MANQDLQACIDGAGQFSVSACTKNGRRARIRVDASEVFRRQFKAPLRVLQLIRVVKEERALGSRERALQATRNQQ